ncbi:MAG: hypothetical protein PHO95_02550 [Bacteroidales bacterium]|nr:hypothetical protein [Bacteroidales bacterium]
MEIKEKDVFTGERVPLRMVEFLKEHHLLTLAVTDGADIWCSHAFYVFIEEENAFLIISEERTRHIQIVRKNPTVSGGVALETNKIGEIRGIQFKADIEQCKETIFGKYKLIYLKSFPYAIFKGGDLWLLRITEAKFTDNRLGFGKKLKFIREKLS